MHLISARRWRIVKSKILAVARLVRMLEAIRRENNKQTRTSLSASVCDGSSRPQWTGAVKAKMRAVGRMLWMLKTPSALSTLQSSPFNPLVEVAGKRGSPVSREEPQSRNEESSIAQRVDGRGLNVDTFDVNESDSHPENSTLPENQNFEDMLSLAQELLDTLDQHEILRLFEEFAEYESPDMRRDSLQSSSGAIYVY